MKNFAYTEVKKDALKSMNQNQTVIVEDLQESKSKKRTVYLGNWKDRKHAFAAYKEANMKTCRKDKIRRFRLLKLYRLLEEVKVVGYNTKTVYTVMEETKVEEPVKFAQNSCTVARI